MIFRQFYDPDLAQGSYLVACDQTLEAAVVDPRRDIGEYLAEAERLGLTITAVTETHIHADYLSGARELAHATGARLLLSAEGGPDWLYGFEHEQLRHDDVINIGTVELRAVHTPGHTPEHLSFLVRDSALADEAGFLLTGDFVFVGDVGRPDLLDEAAGQVDTRFEGARHLFRSLRDRFLTLPDWLQVWPGHGAGSACGKALGSVASTTVGYERRFAWWAPYVRDGDEDGFVNELLTDQPDAPHYFGRMKRLNRAGPELLEDLPPLKQLVVDDLISGKYQLIDTRVAAEFNREETPGTVQVPAGGKFITYASYVLDPERQSRDFVLLAPDAQTAERLRQGLQRVGIDRVVGFTDSVEPMLDGPAPLISPERLPELEDAYLVDVRSASEFAAGHIPGARQLHAGRVFGRLAELPRDRTLVVYCQSGARATPVASALRAEGFDARELDGNFAAWLANQEQAE